MEVLECIKTRHSTRKYDIKKKVPWDHVSNVLDAARFAQSAGNVQAWKFICVLDETKRKALAEACVKQFWMETAPVHIVVVAEPEKMKRHYGDRGERLYSVQSCACAMENMLLAAHSLGLGACWVGAFDEDMVKRTLGIPKEARPQAILTVGYPAEEAEPTPKFPLEVVAYLNNWRGKIKDAAAYMMYYSPAVARTAKKGKAIVQEAGKKAAVKAADIAKNIKKKFEDKKKDQQEELRK